MAINNQEELLLKSYLKCRGKPANLWEVLIPHFLINFVLAIPMILGALLIYYYGVREAAYCVLGMWLGMFLTNIRHGKIFVKYWPTIQNYLDWDKIESSLEDISAP